MYTALSALVFLFLTLYSLNLLFSTSSNVKYKKKLHYLLSGPEKFLLLTVLTGMVATYIFSSLKLMIWIIFVILAFIVYRRNIKINLFIFMCFLFLSYCLIALIWTPSLSYGIRTFLKFLYPVLIMLFAMHFVSSKEFINILVKYLVLVSFILSIFLGGVMTNILGVWNFFLGGLFWPISTLADYFVVISALSFVLWWKTNEKKYLFLIVWFLLSCMLQGVRTGLLSIGIMFIVGIYLRYRILSIPYILGSIVIGFTIILNVPQVKEKMFYDSTQIKTYNDVLNAMDEDNLNTSGRFYIWEDTLKRFYEKNKFFGAGTGAIQNHMYENSHLYNGIKITHNDFVNILNDMGRIGLILYLLIPFTFMIQNFKYLKNPMNSQLNFIALVSSLSYIGLIPSMNFDNVVNYSFPSHSMPYIFIGLFYAYKRILIEEENTQNV